MTNESDDTVSSLSENGSHAQLFGKEDGGPLVAQSMWVQTILVAHQGPGRWLVLIIDLVD